MKRLLFIWGLASFCLATTQAQDLIVLVPNDSINCKITSIKKERIYFTYKTETRSVSVGVPVNQIVTYKKNFYPKSAITSGTLFQAQRRTDSSANATANAGQSGMASSNAVVLEELNMATDFSRMRFAANVGISQRIGNIATDVSSAAESNMTGMKSGFGYDVGLTYFLNQHLGLGAKYSGRISGSDDLIVDATVLNKGYVPTGSQMHFLGPTVSWRWYPNSAKREYWITNLTVGYVSYKEKRSFYEENTQIGERYAGNIIGLKGKTAGIGWDIGYDFGRFGLQGSVFWASLSKYNRWHNAWLTQKTPKQDLFNIALSVGYRFDK